MRVVVAVVVAVVLVGCGGGAGGATTTATAPSGRAISTTPARPTALRWGACPQPLPAFRCGRLTVPLHRRGPRAGDGRTLTLDVAVQRRAGPAPRGDLVLLSGGPGQPGLGFGPRMVQRLGAAAAGHRIVVVDQRGTGRGALRCPALQASAGTSDLAVPPRRAVAACARTLGDRRDAFATADTVADLEALRSALGDATWTLGGVSYGTFVALRYALAHADRTRALVLDSVVPQQGAELLERVPLRATARVLGLVGGPAAVADLRRVTRRHPQLGPRLFDALTERSIGVPRLGPVAAALRTAAGGDLAPLRALLASTAREERGVPPAFYSTGLHAATLCSDAPAVWPGGPAASGAVREVALRRLRAALPAGQTAPWPRSTALGQGLLATCRAWPPTPAPPAPARGAVVRAPALLLAGDHDLSTPLEWARAQAQTMPHARLVVVRGAGHSILTRERGRAGRDALAAFLRAPGR